LSDPVNRRALGSFVNALQFVGALHGYFQGDHALMIGMIATLITCGSITLLAVRFSYFSRRMAPG
jgi:hypothetical protein